MRPGGIRSTGRATCDTGASARSWGLSFRRSFASRGRRVISTARSLPRRAPLSSTTSEDFARRQRNGAEMALSAGSRLGPYEILSPLGAGGMGEVYRARDTRLGRVVALKVLPESLSSDAGRLRRFEMEAHSASLLNHPNIVTVHDVGTSGATSYIAMELVEGATLRRLLGGGVLPLKRLLAIAAQV
ncbi:MAG TPA: protein kinase, partial [Thermoanaerobaculia bacterium]